MDNNKSRRILLLSQYFPPELGAAPQRAFHHAKYWAKMGYTVTVVTNVPNSPFGKIYNGFKNKMLQKENIDGINIVRMWTLPAGKNSNIIRRILSSTLYVLFAQINIFRKKPDVIVGTAPYFAGFAAFIIAKVRRVPLIYEMRDPWLQIIEKNVPRYKIFFKFLKFIEKCVLHRSDKVVVIGEKMSQYIQDHYSLKEKPAIVFNCVDNGTIESLQGAVPPIIASKTKEFFSICFVGNLGVWYDYRIIIEVAKLLINEKIAFFFVGDGKLKKDLIAGQKEFNLENIHVYDILSHQEALAVVKTCDVSILPFAEGVCDLCLPLKFWESLAIGTPVLVCNGEEVELILNSSGAGKSFCNQNPEKLAELIKSYVINPDILKIQGEAGQKYVTERFNREIMAQRYSEIFLSIIKKK